ncbi:unnamed protein product [Sphagnum balticum]
MRVDGFSACARFKIPFFVIGGDEGRLLPMGDDGDSSVPISDDEGRPLPIPSRGVRGCRVLDDAFEKLLSECDDFRIPLLVNGGIVESLSLESGVGERLPVVNEFEFQYRVESSTVLLRENCVAVVQLRAIWPKP